MQLFSVWKPAPKTIPVLTKVAFLKRCHEKEITVKNSQFYWEFKLNFIQNKIWNKYETKVN